MKHNLHLVKHLKFGVDEEHDPASGVYIVDLNRDTSIPNNNATKNDTNNNKKKVNNFIDFVITIVLIIYIFDI